MLWYYCDKSRYDFDNFDILASWQKLGHSIPECFGDNSDLQSNNYSQFTTCSDIITTCQKCNLSIIYDGYVKLPSKILVHNLSGYDGMILLSMIAKVGKKKFHQKDRKGNLLSLPILKGTPRMSFKDSTNKITSITLEFTCPMQRNCIHEHNKHIKDYNKDGSIQYSCPFSRKYEFMDSLLHLPSRWFSLI